MRKLAILLALLMGAGIASRSSAQSCTPVPSGIVSWWKAETNTLDSAGRNDGIAEGSLGYAFGEVGYGFDIPDDSAYVEVPARSSLDVGTGDGFTIELWINPRDVSNQHPLVEYGTGDQPSGHLGPLFWISVNMFDGTSGPGDLLANIVDTSTTSHIIHSATGIVQTNAFQHVALTYDKTTGNAVLYYNGTIVASENLGIFTPNTAAGDLLFGHRTVTDETFPGILDEITLYKRVLSSNEIASIYEAGPAGKCPYECTPIPTNAVSLWEAETNTLDSIGANDGVAEGSLAYTNGEVGDGFYITNAGSYVEVPASSSLDVGTGDGFTMELWINPEDVSIQHPLVEYGTGTQPSGHLGPLLWISVNMFDGTSGPGDLLANIVDTSGTSHIFHSATNIIQPNLFQHVALTYDKTTGVAVLYYDGSVVASQNLGIFTPNTAAGDLLFGHRTVTDETFPGVLDEITLYSRALSASEIEAIYEAGSAGKCW